MTPKTLVPANAAAAAGARSPAHESDRRSSRPALSGDPSLQGHAPTIECPPADPSASRRRDDNYEGIFRHQLHDFIAKELPGFCDLERHAGNFPHATRFGDRGRSAVTVWCSNDYLGMGQASRGAAAMHERSTAAAPARAAPGTSRHLPLSRAAGAGTGRSPPQGGGALFTSGYVSNWAALGTLASALPGCVVLSDAGNHSSMIEGIAKAGQRSRSGGTTIRRIEPQAGGARSARPKLLAFESVYSDGRRHRPIAELATSRTRMAP